ncbi:MAG: FeoA family protein [Armatimonadota bacterium]|nr:FeoA family protein [Armatimonadota bacterium]MDR7452435.1 FeoA family protein [Armatimonadota bacterium]MDR7493564.1 FeoA family protein [Armatimonadota bacterium]MDR7500223.1 FeoA family protein [Armatimonadota bacterium]MDR7548088.1 FeoA family protein [Armatimonadota bacterium]
MAVQSTLLSQLPAGARGVIEALPEDEDLRDELAALRMLPGQAVEVVQTLPMGGPLLVSAGGGLYALGRTVAERVRVLA